MSPIITNKTNTRKSSEDSIEGSDTPEAFICPLTMNVMFEPMVSKYGHNFERKAIMEWLQADSNTESLCPMTRRPLFPSMLISNSQLKYRIRGWRISRGEKVDGYGLGQESGYKVMGEKYRKYDLDGGDLTDTETEVDAEFEAEIDARIAAIVQLMIGMEENHQLGHQTQIQGQDFEHHESTPPKKCRNSRGFLGRFGRKSER